MEKKGVTSTVFVFIFMVILIGFILFFGFEQFSRLTSTGEKAKWIFFQESFINEVEDVYYNNKGTTFVYSTTSRKDSFTLPRDINKICFKGEGDLDSSGLTDDERIVLEASSDNVVIFNFDYESFNVENLRPSVNPLCINVENGKLSFVLENVFGDETYVEIREI